MSLSLSDFLLFVHLLHEQRGMNVIVQCGNEDDIRYFEIGQIDTRGGIG